MASLKTLKTQFLEYIEIEKGRSLNTIENYDRYLSRFLGFLKKDDPQDITDDSVREFRLWLNRQSNLPWKTLQGSSGVTKNNNIDKTLSKKTQNYYLIALRAFLKYLARREVKSLPAERIELAKISERTLDLITSDELTRLLNSPNGSDLKSLRDKAILELLFSTGLRVTELCALPRDMNIEADELSVRGKGGKVRVVFISPEARTAVKNYLAKRADMEDALFVRVDRESVFTDTIEKVKAKLKAEGAPLSITGNFGGAGSGSEGEEPRVLEGVALHHIFVDSEAARTRVMELIDDFPSFTEGDANTIAGAKGASTVAR